MSLLRLTRLPLFAVAIAFTASLVSLADDAAGILRVGVATNGETSVEMPFFPFGDATPDSFLSGPFWSGDGDLPPDRLYLFSESLGLGVEMAYSTNGWIETGTGEAAATTATPGDGIVFVPGDDGDATPFDIFLFGRAPDVAARSGSPRILGMAVDADGAFADIDIFTRGLATDFYTLDIETNGVATSAWAHQGRHPGLPILFAVRDEALPDSGGRLYLVSDATRDTDGDGIPDDMERRVHGTSPYLADTDGDGVSDTLELAWGSNPLVFDCLPSRTLFFEPFEPPDVQPGPVAGQNGWSATGAADAAAVQSDVVYEGTAALGVDGAGASHSVTGAADVVWLDFRQYQLSGSAEQDDDPDFTAITYFTTGGHPVMSDGPAFCTNTQFSINGWRRWTRCTMKFDFRSRTWDFYVDGMVVGTNLRMRGDATAVHELAVTGETYVDDIRVTTDRPPGLSSDGDALPDEWEMAHFGDLSHDGRADSDNDGMDDLAEYRAGTDPLAPNGDSDDDGLPDWWEAANGLNPFAAAPPSRAVFRETFEPPDVANGDIAGQHGWGVSAGFAATNAATVQNRIVHNGTAALEVRGGDFEDGEGVEVRRASASRAEIVWMDFWQMTSGGSGLDGVDPDVVVFVGFDPHGHPVLSDGAGFVTNLSASVGDEERWARCSCHLDFPNRTWDFYLDGILVNEGLAMRGDSGAFHSLAISGGHGYFDDIYVGFARPEGLSSDGDALPDEWEFRTFGSLDRDGNGDFDGDGLTDAQEFAAGTDTRIADTDDDGLPDGWELAHGLDPLAAADAADDPDGDGLSTLDEYGIGTDPFQADTDGDGMPDGWEHEHGTDPFAPDALEDPDGDGLPNIGEMRHGTDWLLADTDGDGVSDGEEVNVFLSAPTSVDFDGTIVTNGVVRAKDVDEATGDWFKCDGCVSLASRCGRVFFNDDLSIGNGGVFQLRMQTAFKGASDAELTCLVDGLRIGEVRLPSSSAGVAVEAVFNTRWLSVGIHELAFELQNFSNSAEFAFGDIAVCELGGPDSDGDGVADWIDNRRHNTRSARGGIVHSKVSPFCLRGVSVEEPVLAGSSRSYGANPLPHCGWWADIPIKADSATDVHIVFERGFKEEDVSIVWEEFNVLDEPDTVLRKGDSLLLSLGGADGTISVNGAIVADGASPISQFRFDSAGDYLIAGASGDLANTLKVRVVECSFSGSHPIWRGKRNAINFGARGWESMSVSWDGGADLAATAVSGPQCVCSLSVPLFAHPSSFACEIDNPDASVAGSVALQPFWIFYTIEGKYFEESKQEDGTRIVANRISAFDLPRSVEFRMTSSSGICFEDGSGRLVFAADDLDETGDLNYRFFVPAGVNHPCQFLHGYFNGKALAQ